MRNGETSASKSVKRLRYLFDQLPADAKCFVVDTNVPMSESEQVIRSFGRNLIVLPLCLIKELDHHKRYGENGKMAAARAAMRTIDHVIAREEGKGTNDLLLSEGIRTEEGGMLMTFFDAKRTEQFLRGFSREADDQIVAAAGLLKKDLEQLTPPRELVLISNDRGVRLIAGGFGIKAQEHESGKVARSKRDLYSGICELTASPGTVERLSGSFQGADRMPSDQFWEIAQIEPPPLLPNQGIIIADRESKRPFLGVHKTIPELGVARITQHRLRNGEVGPRNNRQQIAWYLLNDPTVDALSLTGITGGGKTLLALKAACDQERKFPKGIMVFRAMVEVGETMGFLPGDATQKFAPWEIPIEDALGVLLKDKETKRPKMLSVQPINHSRGRSLHDRFMIIDEAQNMTEVGIKTITTRAGENTKVVVTGDISQVDISPTATGLARFINKMVGDDGYAHITFDKSERSSLAERIANRLSGGVNH